MRIPHITIEYEEEDGSAIGKLSPSLIVGLGLHWAWIFITMFGGDVFSLPDTMADFAYPSSLAFMCMTLIAYAVFYKPLHRLFGTKRKRLRNRAIGAFMSSGGTGLLLIYSIIGLAEPAWCIVSGVLTGIGSAILMMSYGVSFSTCETSSIVMSMSLVFVLAALLSLFIITLNGILSPVGAVAAILIPWGELICLQHCSKELVDKLNFTMLALDVDNKRLWLRIGLPNLIIGAALGILREYGMQGFLSFDPLVVALFVALAGVITSLFLFAVLMVRDLALCSLFRISMPLTMLALVVLLYMDDCTQSAVSFCTLFVCYLMLEIAAWVSYADISQQYRMSPFKVFGAGRGCLALGTLLIHFAMPSIGPLFASLSGFQGAMVIVMALLAIGYAALPTESEVAGLLRGSHRSEHADIYGDTDIDEFLLSGESADVVLHPKGRSKRADVPEVSAESWDVAQVGALGDEADARIAPDRASVRAASEQDGGDELVAERPDDGGADSAAHGHDEDTSADIGEGQSEDDEGTKHKGRFMRRCDAVARRYLLSRKETEVLFLLAKGRNAAYIQEELCNAPGTIRTHMRNIYRKLDVHSQSELMDLVENTDIDDEDL